MVTELSQRSALRRDRIAIHAAGLFVKENMVAYAEDAGRHNTVDKIIGEAMELGLDFSESVIVTTGRQASDMVLKAARAGVPIVVAMRGALYSGIFVAWKTNLTLVAHAQRSSMEIYTYPDRILISRSPSKKVVVSPNVPTLACSTRSDLKSDKRLDLRHLLCPTLLQELTEAMKTIGLGELVEVITADPITLVDIPAWAYREKQQIVSIQDDWLTIRFFLKRLT
jgi:TusA-related sulfurtransferase